MFQRLLVWTVRSYIRGPARSWIYTSLALGGVRLIRRVAGRRPVVETLSVAPGQKITVEHLQISHRRQIAEQRDDRKRLKRQARRDGRRSLLGRNA